MTYEQALAGEHKTGASRCTDAELMAGLLAGSAQILLGAVSPKLLWEGAQARGISTSELASLMQHDPDAARDLMWKVEQ